MCIISLSDHFLYSRAGSPMAGRKKREAKEQALRAHLSLNRRPERVVDELFQEADFFDPRDLVQVKYEMLRKVRVEERSVSEAAARFGFSRPAFYQAQGAFEQQGLVGLLPRKRGPRRRHKVRGPVMDFVKAVVEQEEGVSMAELSRRVEESLGIKVHPRSIARALKAEKKNLR